MTKTRTFGVRLDDRQIDFAERLSNAVGLAETTALRRLVPTAPWDQAFANFARMTGEADVLAVPLKLMADGLRKFLAMTRDGIKAEYTDVLLNPNDVAGLFVEWCDGFATKNGWVGPLGNKYTLVEGEYGHMPEPNPAWVAPKVHNLIAAATANLRSPDLKTRIAAGGDLVQGLDLSPDRAALLGRAIAGDAAAADELAAALAADPFGEKGGARA